MANHRVGLNQQDVSVFIKVLNTDGTPFTGLGDSPLPSGITMWYQRGQDNAVVSTISGITIHGAVTAAHVDWAYIHVENGLYRCDFPDAAFLEDVAEVRCGIYATGYVGMEATVEIDAFIKFHGQATSVTATTTTFDSNQPVYVGDTIYVTAGTGIGQTRLITSVAGNVATHAAWDINISSSASTIALIPGDEVTADAIVNMDASVSTRSTVDTADLDTAAQTALSDIGLDMLVSATADGASIVDNSIIAKMVSASSTADWDTFNNVTDSLETLGAGSVDTNAIAQAVWNLVLDSTYVTAESAAVIVKDILNDTGTSGVLVATAAISDGQITTAAVNKFWETALTESYSTDGAQGTAAQILYGIQQFLFDADISGTTLTIRKLDGTTSALVLTFDDPDTPTDKNRTS